VKLGASIVCISGCICPPLTNSSACLSWFFFLFSSTCSYENFLELKIIDLLHPLMLFGDFVYIVAFFKHGDEV
jgi:hypothetical protein